MELCQGLFCTSPSLQGQTSGPSSPWLLKQLITDEADIQTYVCLSPKATLSLHITLNRGVIIEYLHEYNLLPKISYRKFSEC